MVWWTCVGSRTQLQRSLSCLWVKGAYWNFLFQKLEITQADPIRFEVRITKKIQKNQGRVGKSSPPLLVPAPIPAWFCPWLLLVPAGKDESKQVHKKLLPIIFI